ncbi:hypothetical protein FTW19_11535 [Terriglobus albidus]|uniref:Uncharacterized protein n=1 Tax=Terriglobus albidus TaxID=1592106 RepID=A0A5B9E8L2_9BACT|nr:hypothetical protein [Terriglobus albidus]QEE28572.1 hypothetical protein FTW19_11535 [Terriglobus albidus]
MDEIEEHLRNLGSGNHSDNMDRLSRFSCYFCVVMTEDDFLGTVFLQNPEVASIVPEGESRKLRDVARRGIDLQLPVLGPNWNLATNLDQMRSQLAGGSICLGSPVLCEARDGEEKHGAWYLQDGSHRSLAYAMLLLMGEAQYEEQIAFCAMNAPMAAALTR